LKDSEHIAKILGKSQRRANDVLVCATGHLWDDNEERGVYQTTDGGKTWKKKSWRARMARVAARMIARSKQEPKNNLRRPMWDFLAGRDGTFRSGGPGSGLFKSTDGGEHWSEVSDSKCERFCRPSPGDAWRCRWLSRSRKSVVYANIEAEKDEASTARMTAAERGRSSMPATIWCGVRFTLAI